MTAEQLKNSILQMAVQGKLVPQDPSDEPASVLLERIKAEKQELIKAGKIKKDTKNSEIFRGTSRNSAYAYCEQIGKEIRDISDEIPFDIPDSWEWCRLGNVCKLIDGEKVIGKAFNNLDARYMRGKGEATILNEGKYVEKGTRLILVDGENSGEVFIAPENGYMGSTFKILWIAESLFANYILHFIDFHRITLKNSKKGAAIPHLNKDLFFNLYLPLPPLAEQKRIVAKIEELLPYIEQYEKSETQLSALNESFPEMLKKSILQEAVQGKLVPQDPSDEPASVLLERIKAEKQKLIKDGKIKKDKHESVIFTRDKIPYEIADGKERCIADEVPFDIPESWEWCRVGSISWYFDAGKSPNCVKQSVSGNEYGVITTTSIQFGYFDEKQNKVLPPNFEIKEDMKVNKGDILITRAGPMNRTGIACVVKDIHYNLILSDKTIRINMSDDLFDKDYIVTVLNSPNIREQIIGLMSGMDKQQVNISQDKYKTVFIPLPPLAEQKRIVAKIEKLMNIINKIR